MSISSLLSTLQLQDQAYARNNMSTESDQILAEFEAKAALDHFVRVAQSQMGCRQFSTPADVRFREAVWKLAKETFIPISDEHAPPEGNQPPSASLKALEGIVNNSVKSAPQPSNKPVDK